MVIYLNVKYNNVFKRHIIDINSLINQLYLRKIQKM